MKCNIFWLACLAMAPLGVQAGELYRWVDKSGNVHYSDILPAGVTDAERKNFSSVTTQGEDLPYETLRAQKNFPVALYVTNGCGAPCNQARAMLNKRGIPYSEKSLRTQEELDAFYKVSGSNVAPTLAIGKNFLSGFQEAEWNSELDLAGYPKTASYRQRAAPPPANKPAAENQGAPGVPAAQ